MKEGSVVEKIGIQSSLSPFYVLPDFKVRYPETVIRALGEAYMEYNGAFIRFVRANREWQTDYQYAMPSGYPMNFAVQIDMMGLSDDFLQAAAEMREEEVLEILRGKIFEIENSIAMYQLLENLFSDHSGNSCFKRGWRATLNELRKFHNMPIALLAVTQEKYDAMKASEFGKGHNDPLTDEEVRRLSGFDKLFGPDEFCEYLARNKGKCGYLLFVRSSDPVCKLKKPETQIEHPLLGDSELRRIIKANSLTFNIDNPSWRNEDYRRVNDTKEYMSPMGMAFQLANERDLYSHTFAEHLLKNGNPFADFPADSRLSPEFAKYFESSGVKFEDVASGSQILRFKPMKNSYGCYGHIIGRLTDRRTRQEVRQNLRARGSYVVQPELKQPTAIIDGREYAYIDRNFLTLTGGTPRFIGGFRSFMPVHSQEGQNGRNHGSKYTVWGEILGD